MATSSKTQFQGEKSMSNFVDMCVQGDVLLEEVDDFVDEWHESGGNGIPLHTYLGMNRSEYSLWTVDPDVLPFVVAARRENRDVAEVIEQFNALPLAARADGPLEARKLLKWLKSEGLWE
jgi:hypothetical protein